MTSSSQRFALRAAALLAAAFAGGCATSADDTNVDAASFGPPDGGHTADGGMDGGVVILGDSSFPSFDVVTPPADTGTHDTATLMDVATTPDSPSGMDSPMTTVDTGVDTGTPDTGRDTGSADVSSPDTGTATTCPAPATHGCAPRGLPQGFAPFTPTQVTMAGSCSASHIQTIYDDCFGQTASMSKCDSDGTNLGSLGDCYACINGGADPTAMSWGPILDTPNNLVELNVGGCLQLLEPASSACATSLSDDFQCEQAECAAGCTVSGTSSQNAYVNCIDTVDGCNPGGCNTYASGALCVNGITGMAHPGSVCFPDPTDPNAFEEGFLAVAAAFCD